MQEPSNQTSHASIGTTPMPGNRRAQLLGNQPMKRWIKSLRVGQKIGFGYAIALGIAMAGTTAGILIGNHYQQIAEDVSDHAHTEINLLYRLQTGVLQVRTHQQQLISLLERPADFQAEYAHLIEHAAWTQDVWRETRSFILSEEHLDSHIEEMQKFARGHDGVIDDYLQELDAIVQAIEWSNWETATNLEASRQSLLAFTNSPIALRFDQISDQLTDITEATYAENQAAAELAKGTAQELRIRVILVSMLASVAIATLLVVYTSRTIARPLQAVTAVAQRVTEESNFSLQAPVTTQDEVGVLATSLNQLIQRVKTLLEEQKLATAQRLLQHEKMSSLGQMVAGVAHEINNPVNFIYGNLAHINEYLQDLLDLLHLYAAEVPNAPTAVQQKIDDIDLAFLEDDLPKLMQSIQVGADRTRQIVLSLRNFSRLDDQDTHQVDVHDCLDSTLLILNNRIKNDITVVRNYGELPAIEGYAGSLYQVFMNILSNAIDALGEKPSGTKEVTITTTCCDDHAVVIRIADNGAGIAPEYLEKVFETFFTTKPVGVGTGLGLSISREIVEDKHGGKLVCQSSPGLGTEFSITLPIKHQHTEAQTLELAVL